MRGRYVSIVCVALIAGAVTWCTTRPRTAIGLSTSIEPYDLVFKVDTTAFLNDDSKAGSIREWRLTIPRSFIWMEIGDNDDVGGRSEGFHSVSLYTTFHPEGRNFSAGVFSGNRKNEEGFFINLDNGIGPKKFDATQQCVREHEYFEWLGSRFKSRECKADSIVVRCNAHMGYKGWSVKVGMPKKYYFGDYQTYCDAVRTFLDQNVTYVDDVRGLGR